MVKQLKSGLASKLKSLHGTISITIDHIKKAQHKAKGTANSILNDLNSGKSHKGFIYELDTNNLKKFVEAYENENEATVSHIMEAIENVWDDTVSSFDQYHPVTTSVKLYQNLNTDTEHESNNLWRQTKVLHDAVIKNDPTISSVLLSNIYKRLEQLAQGDNTRLEGNIKKFLNNFNPSVSITPSLGITNPQTPPMRALAIGLPDIGEAGELREFLTERISNSVGTKVSAGRLSVYTHNCGNEIRLLYSEYWMPARFMDVVGIIEGHYMRAISTANTPISRATLYFANIDDEGAKPTPKDRPQLTSRALFDEDTVKDLEIAKMLYVVDDKGTTHPLIQTEEFKLFVWKSFEYGFPQYQEFSSSIANAPSSPFRAALQKGLSAAADSMSNEQKQEIKNKLLRNVAEKDLSAIDSERISAMAQIKRVVQILDIK